MARRVEKFGRDTWFVISPGGGQKVLDIPRRGGGGTLFRTPAIQVDGLPLVQARGTAGLHFELGRFLATGASLIC